MFKIHVFTFAMLITQEVAFLHFKMFHTCINILIYLLAPVKDEIFIPTLTLWTK
jgi:hypothetical protein